MSDREFITVSLGTKNSAGDWIVTDRPDVQAHPTRYPQIWITPNLSKTDRSGEWVLSHYESGMFLLGPYTSLTVAREAADILVKIIPVDQWDVMERTKPDSHNWKRDRVRERIRQLSSSDREWLRANGAFSIQ